MRKLSKKGFTLIELLVVVAIIGILATVVVVNLSGAQKKARDAKTTADISSVQSALLIYFVDKGAYPSWIGAESEAPGGLSNNNVVSALVTSYIGTIPTPKIRSSYQYTTAPSAAGAGPTATAYGILINYENQIRNAGLGSLNGNCVSGYYCCQIVAGYNTLSWWGANACN